MDWYSENWTNVARHEPDWEADWKPLRKSAAAIFKHAGIIQSHIIRLSWRYEASKIDKLADKARAQLFKRPDVVQWVEADEKNNGGELTRQLRQFVDNMPSDAYKLLPWMWTQVKSNPALLSNPDAARQRELMYEVGTTFNLLNRNNKPTPDIHRMNYVEATEWMGSTAVQKMIEEMRPVQWEDPEHHFTASDGKHVVHRITNAEDATREGEMMGHCVGGYGSQIENGSTNIFSLRDHMHRPHVTIEMKPVGDGGESNFDSGTLEPGDRVRLTGISNRHNGQGATIVERGPHFGQYTIRMDGTDATEVIDASAIRDYYSLRYKVGDKVYTNTALRNTFGEGPREIVKVQHSHAGDHYAIDYSADGGSELHWIPETSIVSLADGTVPEKPYIHKPKPSLPTEHRVTQVFGKSDQAPIAKYRKMVREFFDDLREKGHTLHWAGNEFLPENVDSMADAEAVWDFLDDLHSHLQEQDEANTDSLGVAQSIVETGSMAHEYGFSDDSTVMEVDWDDMLDDFIQKSTDGDDIEDMVNHIMAVAAVTGVSYRHVAEYLRRAENKAEEHKNDQRNHMMDRDEEYSWGEIHEVAEDILRDKFEKEFHTVDHGEEKAFNSDQYEKVNSDEPEDEDEYEEWANEVAEAHDEAEEQYRQFKWDNEDEAEEEARDTWRENWEPSDDSHERPEDALHELTREIKDSGIEQHVSRVLRVAMDKNASDATVNHEWSELTRALAKSPKFYAMMTHSFPNMVRRAYEYAKIQVAAQHKELGWQQVLPKGEKPMYNTNERTEQLLEALERMVKTVHHAGEPDWNTHRNGEQSKVVPRQFATQRWLQDHSLHEPFHSPVTPPKAQRQPRGPLPNYDLITDNALEPMRSDSPLRDAHGQGLLKGDVIQHPDYGVGTIKDLQGWNDLTTIDFDREGRYTFGPKNQTNQRGTPWDGTMVRVGSTDWEITSAQ